MRYTNKNIKLASGTIMMAVHPDYDVKVDSIDDSHSQVTVHQNGRVVYTIWTKNITDVEMGKLAAMGIALETMDLFSPGKSANGGAFGQKWVADRDDSVLVDGMNPQVVSARVRVDSKLDECVADTHDGLRPYTDPKNDGVFALYICRFAVSPTRQELWLDDTAPIGKLCKRTAKEKDTARANCLISDAARLRERADTMEAEAQKILAKYPAKKAKKTS